MNGAKDLVLHQLHQLLFDQLQHSHKSHHYTQALSEVAWEELLLSMSTWAETNPLPFVGLGVAALPGVTGGVLTTGWPLLPTGVML